MSELRKSHVSGEPTVTQELFENPPAKYRGAPFWAWNCELEPEKLLRQIPHFKEMGFGGFYMHSRAGLSLAYMSQAFLERVKLCVDEAKKLDLIPYLYDEDTFPSGFAGGKVVKGHPEYRRRVLRVARKAEASAYRTVGRYDICLNEDGTLASYRLLGDGEQAVYQEWTAQILVEENSRRYNLSAYIDTLNPEAVRHFIALTYEAYQSALGEKFGRTAPSIFTDEPRTPKLALLPRAAEEGEAILPWTDIFPDSFYAAAGRDIVAALPELVWDLKEHKPSQLRWQYYDHVAELFARSFFDTVGAWCDQAGIEFVGHLMDEFPLLPSIINSGEAMRCYRSMTVPGIDMLCGNHEYTTAKQAQSAVRQFGRAGMVSELYGVIGWDGDFREHKLQGDWQAALGVTRRVPHLAWCSMKGEGKRDYPQSIFYQSPWYREYPLIEDHFARVNLAMTQGKPVCHIGVIHPIESFWLHCGPLDSSERAMGQIEENWENITQWLLFGGYDFDFISESLLPGLCEAGGAPLRVGESRYDAILVPACETLRRSTLERLVKFREAGGTLIFLGQPPACVDAVPNPEPGELAAGARILPFEKQAILTALSEFREIALQKEDGSEETDLLYQLREDDGGRWLFLAHGKNPEAGRDAVEQRIRLTICGEWKLEFYDTMSGEIRQVLPVYEAGRTVLTVSLYPHDSLLLRLTGGRTKEREAAKPSETLESGEGRRPGQGVQFGGALQSGQALKFGEALRPGQGAQFGEALRPGQGAQFGEVLQSDGADGGEISIPVPMENAFLLSEPNVLLLDTAQYRLDAEAWQPEEEILRLDHRCRRMLDWHGGIQPWLIPDEIPAHTLTLRFRIHSDVEISGVRLALENSQSTKIQWNGEDVSDQADGWYVDYDIHTLPLPPVKKGENVLILTVPFQKKVTTEWCYLLGDFGVQVEGRRRRLTKRAQALRFDSIVPQTLPFYSGAVTYHIPFRAPVAGTLRVRIPSYRAALLKCSVDGGEEHAVAFAPYESKAEVSAGEHVLHLRAYINRTNGFGPVHNTDRNLQWFGQEAWKTDGDAWTYEYVLQKEGVLAAPALTLRVSP